MIATTTHYTTKELASRFAVNEKTIHRMAQRGAPHTIDHHRGGRPYLFPCHEFDQWAAMNFYASASPVNIPNLISYIAYLHGRIEELSKTPLEQ